MKGKDNQTMRSKAIRYVCITLLTFVVVAVYAFVALNLKVFSPMAKAIGDYSFEDFYYQILGTAESDTSRIVTIVDMTESYNRRELATAINEIALLQPRSIGIDVVFEGLKPDSASDRLLADVALQSHAIFGYKIIDRDDSEVHSFFTPNDSIDEGFVNMPRQLYGGLKRSLHIGRTHQGKLVPSLIKKVADRYAGEEVVPLSDEQLRINFSPLHFEVVHYDKIMEHPELIYDRVVLLGAMKEENDMHYTPLGKIAGTELLAYGVETLLRQNKVYVLTGWPLWLISFFIVLITVIIRNTYTKFAKSQSPIICSIMSLGLCLGLVVFCTVAVFVWGAFILFCKYNISINLGYALAATAFIYSATDLYDTIKKSISKKQ